MKKNLSSAIRLFAKRILLVLFFGLIFISSCKKSEVIRTNSTGNQFPPSPPITPPSASSPCGNRPIVQATLIPIGSLSSARIRLSAASAGNKILFVGGWHEGQNWWNEDVPVDIYDISSNTWSTHYLSPEDPNFTHFRFGAGITAVGNKILIAGGGDAFGDNQLSQVDIFDVSTNKWEIQHLSSERQFLTAASIGDKAFFAGGFGYPDGSNWGEFNTVDIYNNSTNSWSTAKLSQARQDINATTVDNKIYFAGGRNGVTPSKTIDIYDGTTNSWSVSSLKDQRTAMAGIAADGKIFWTGGAYALNNAGWVSYDNAEILDLNSGITSSACIQPRSELNAVRKNDDLIFFTGYSIGDWKQFEIYNINTGKWSTGLLDQQIRGAAIISVNNTIYVAGGILNGIYSDKVWKLEF